MAHFMRLGAPLVFHEEWCRGPPQDHQDPIIVAGTKDEVEPAGSLHTFSASL